MTRQRALVVEDERAARDYLVRLLRASDRIGSVAVAETVAAARRAVRIAEPEVLFVDVRLVNDGEVAGLHFAREVISAAPDIRIVVTTALDYHALDAFDLGAVDYLLKPFTPERLARTLDRIAPAPTVPSARLRPTTLVGHNARGLVLLDLDEVFAAEAVDRLTYVHSTCGRYALDISLAALEDVPDGGWLRVHRNWLVRLGAIRALERNGGDLVLRIREPHTLRIPIARARAASVRDVLLRSALGQRSAARERPKRGCHRSPRA